MFYTTIASTISPAIISLIINVLGGANVAPILYGKILTIFVLIGYCGAIPFFYLAGKSYKKHMECLETSGWRLMLQYNF